MKKYNNDEVRQVVFDIGLKKALTSIGCNDIEDKNLKHLWSLYIWHNAIRKQYEKEIDKFLGEERC